MKILLLCLFIFENVLFASTHGHGDDSTRAIANGQSIELSANNIVTNNFINSPNDIQAAAPLTGNRSASERAKALSVSDDPTPAKTTMDSSSSTLAWHDMISKVPLDLWLFTKHDVWNGEYATHFLGIAALTAVLLTTDDATWNEGNRWYNSNSMVTRTSIFFKEFGDGRTQFGLAAAFAAYGWLGNNPRALRTGSQIVEVVLGSGAVVQILKHITGRESPFVSTAPGGKWRFFPNQISYLKHVPAFDAMPSGHICTSVATFVLIAENYPECKSWMVPLSCFLTASIGVGMVNTGIHWYSDYPLGIAIGYAFGQLVAHRESYLTKDIGPANCSVTPYISGTSAGMAFNAAF